MSRLVLALTLIVLAIAPLAAAPRSDAHAAAAPLVDASSPLPARLKPGSTATAQTAGECLRIRAEPTIEGLELACAEDGSSVVVLDGVAKADGYTWQQIRFDSVIGWAADLYLVPTEPEPICDTRTTPPGLFGHLRAEGGPSLVVWGGGTAAGIIHAATARGVTLRSLWVMDDTGRWIPYVVGAPAFVNQRWFEHFPGGRLPTPTALLAITVPPATPSVDRLPPPTGAAPTLVGVPAPEIEAVSAIVVDAASGAVLYERDPRTQLPPASLTKIVTAILAIEGSDLGSWVRTDVDYRTLDEDSSFMGLMADDCFTMIDLLYGLMVRSGNDAALAIGRHLSGSDDAFVASMNALVERFRLADTHFANPHGLHDEAQYSSAYDLAMLARYAMTLPAFAEIVGSHSWTTSGSSVIGMRTLNTFLTSYDDADGVKTGYTEEAGLTLVASATRDGRRVIAVLLNAPERATAAAALLEWAFTQHVWPE